MMRVAVVTAVRAETRAVLAALTRVQRVRGAACPTWIGEAGVHGVTVLEGGVGRERAARAATLLAPDPDVLLSCGFAGGLRGDLAPGTPAICDRVVWEADGARRSYDVPPPLLARVRSALPPDLAPSAVRGTLLSSPVVLAAVAAKAAAARCYAATAVEMEAAALAEHARATGIALLPLRVILDPLDLGLEGLPANLERSWLARAQLLGRPRAWPTVLLLMEHLATAARTLTRIVKPALRALE